MLLVFGVNELGSHFGPVSGARTFYWAYLFLGLGEWAYAPIFKPYQSLIGGIWFDLQDNQLLGIILLPLMMRFGLIYGI